MHTSGNLAEQNNLISQPGFVILSHGFNILHSKFQDGVQQLIKQYDKRKKLLNFEQNTVPLCYKVNNI